MSQWPAPTGDPVGVPARPTPPQTSSTPSATQVGSHQIGQQQAPSRQATSHQATSHQTNPPQYAAPAYGPPTGFASPPPTPPRRQRWWPLVVLVALALAINGALVTRVLRPSGTALPPATSPATTAADPTSPASSASPTSSAPSATPESTSPAPPKPTGPVDLTSLSQGVVLIVGETASARSNGTGMVISPDGEILTNYHVVEGTQQITVIMATTKQRYKAVVVGSDQSRDVALLRVNGVSGWTTVRFDSDGSREGDKVIQVGNSGGQGYLDLAKGSIIDLDTEVSVKDDLSPTGRTTLTGVVETDTAAVPGDSGGPMYDSQGEVLGMTSAGNQDNATTQGDTITYHIPWDAAMAVVLRIRHGRNTATVRVGGRAFLGVTLAENSMKVATLVKDGPAAKAGVPVGAVVTSINGDPLDSRAELYQTLAKLAPGTQIELGWTDSSGNPRTSPVTLGTNPAN